MRKPKQKVEQKLEISECFLKQLKVLQERSDGSSAIDFLLWSVEETDTTKQTSSLKKAIDDLKKLLSTHDNLDVVAICLQVLCYVFMDCDAKNPCRRTIASFFQGLDGPFWMQTLEYMNQALLKTVENVTKASISCKSDEDVDFRKHIDTVCSLLENFVMGEKCVSMSVITVLEFLVMSLECQVIRESLVGTPALQTAAMLDCLVTIKATMSVVQKCNEQLTQELNNEQKVIQLFQRFLKVIAQILKNDAFFPDCRSAAGMVFPLIVQMSTTKDTLVSIIVSLFFPCYIRQPALLEHSVSSHWIFATVHCLSAKDISGFSYLSVCFGVMTMVARDALVTKQNYLCRKESNNTKGTLLLDVLFPEITSLCSKLKDSSSLVAFRTLACWTSETREAISNAAVDDCFKARLIGTSEIIQTLLNFVWNYWDHPLEAMRYHTRDIFDNVVKMHVIASGNEPLCDPFMEELSRKLCEMDCFVRGKYGPLCCLVNILGAQTILNFHPTVPQDLMVVMCDQSIVPHAMEFAAKMFKCHLEQLSQEMDQYLEVWFKMWVVPGLRRLSCGVKTVRKQITDYYIPKLLKCCPESLHLIIRELQKPVNSDEGGSGSDNVGCLVTCLKTARRLGLLPRAELFNKDEESTNELWQDTIPLAILEQSLCHLDDEIRGDVLGLLCDSVRTTEVLTRNDLELLKNFFPANMNSQSPSFRQHALGMAKKLFIRLRDGGRSLKKKLCGRNLSVDLMEVQLNYYIEFLRWFAHLQFGSLFPGASFPRRTTALQNLKLLLQIFPMSSENGDAYSIFECSEVFTSRTVHILLDCLKDTYDVNKQMAFDLLVACPSSIHPFMDPEFALEWTTTATLSAVSPKAINVSTAAFLFKLLIRKSPHEIILPSRDQPPAELDDKASGLTTDFRLDLKPSEETSNHDSVSSGIVNLSLTEVEKETSIPCQQAFRVLSQLVKILLAQIEVARKSLLQAAFEAPIHGVLYCVREIICDFDLNDIAGSKLWQSLVMAILQGCYDVSDVVSPVVTNASPEGNLMDSNGFVDDEDFVEKEDFAPKAQILLVCCWRAMKEVSLLLGEITKRAPIKEKGSDHGLMSFEEFDVIGQLFTNILLTSKHRGAYELAHEGFVKLCYMLWRCKQRELQSLPKKFLTTLLGDISSDTPTPWLCGTRRSAGLPFFFKAIITTEPSTTGKCCFKTVIRELLSTAAKALTTLESNKDTTLPQVHARNILRALYKETKLGEDVYPYVAEGMHVAVEGFLSDSWAVRNSSTLLFSALMNRIFGPQKFQEEKRRQGMTGREFFSRFPSLHSFLIKQLEISLSSVESESNKSIHLHPSLYPVLLLLSRLHPSAMDGNDSTLNMAAFIPYVLRCSKSYVLKTRAMAARALVPLVSGDALPEMFQVLLERLPGDTKQRVCQNQVHGCLLQIRDLLNSIAVNTTLSTRTKETIAKKFVPLLLKHKWLASCQNPCDMTRAVFLCIIRKFVLDQTWITGETQTTTPSPLDLTVLKDIIEKAVDETLKNEDIKPELFSIGKTFVKDEIARIALQPIYAKSCAGDLHATDVSCILAFLSTSDYEVTLVALKFLYQIFMNCKGVSFPGNQINVIVKELLCQVMNPTMQCSCLSELYKCLSLVPRYQKFPWELADQRFVTLSEGWQRILLACQGSDQQTEMKCSVLEFSGVLVNQLHEEALCENPKDCIVRMLEEWVSFVETCAENEESEILRLTVTRIIGSGGVTCILSTPHYVNEYLPFRLWKLIVRLLVDDSVDVKFSMAAGLANVFQGIGQDSLKYGSMHSALALQYIIRKPLELFWSQFPMSCVLWLLSLLDDTSADTLETEADTGHHSAYDDMESMDRLFEKGPTNTYCEDCILAETVFNTFTNWLDEHKADTKGIPHRSKLLSSIQVFVKKQSGKCDESLPQNVLFFNIYKTMIGLAILNILTQNPSTIEGDDESTAIQQALDVVREIGSSLQQIRRKDSGHCFYHFKLQEISEFVLGK